MHHLDFDLFCYQIDFMREILRSQHNNALVDEIDFRIATIPHFPNLKIFSKGLQIAMLTANKYQSLIKQIIFVLDNLYNENDKGVDNFISNNELVKLYESWNKMYIISRSEEFSEDDLNKFQVS